MDRKLTGKIPRDSIGMLELPQLPAGVLAAYRAQGLHLVQRFEIEGWATLRLAHGGASRRLV